MRATSSFGAKSGRAVGREETHAAPPQRNPHRPHRAHGPGRLMSPLPSPIPISVSLCLMRRFSSGRIPTPQSSSPNLTNFFVWREFVWGAIAGAFGEGMLHPIDTLKTRLQSQAIITGTKAQKNIFQMVRIVWTSVGLRGFYRGISPGVTGSFATGATYFGVIESTKTWLENANPNLSGHWSHFIAGGIGDTLGSFIYMPCEVMKQRMQVQGTRKSWASTATKGNICKTPGTQIYDDTGFKINNVKYEGSLLIVENKIMTWTPKTFAEITAESLSIFKPVHPIPGCGSS